MRIGFFKFAMIFASVLSAIIGYTVYRTSLDFYELGSTPPIVQIKLSGKDDIFYKTIRAGIIKSGVDDSYETNLALYEKMFKGVLSSQDIVAVFESCKANKECVGPSTLLLRQAAEKSGTVSKFDQVVIKNLAVAYNTESLGPTIEYKVVLNGNNVEYVANTFEKNQKYWENINRLSRHQALEDAQWYILIGSITLFIFTVMMFKRR